MLPVPESLPFDGDLEDLSRVACDEIRKQLGACAPHEDPQPLIFATHPQREEVVVLPLPDHWFTSREAKLALGQQVIAPLAAVGSQMMAVAMAFWQVKGDTPAGEFIQELVEADKPIPAFNEIALDGVKEILGVYAMAPDRMLCAAATVTRSLDEPPQLGEWEVASSDANGFESHLYDSAREGWNWEPLT